MALKNLFITLICFYAFSTLGQTSVADGDWIDGPTWGGASPGYTGLNNPTIDSYVIANSGLTFAIANGRTLQIQDTLIVYGDVNFATDKNNAGITIGPDNVLIIFGNLEMGKNNAGVDIAAGGVLVVTGNITASGNNGEITGDGNYYTNGSTSGMANNSSNPEGTEDDLSNDGYSSIEEFVKGGGATPLPVTLTYFKAEAKSAVLLTWATSTEINNNYFVVQRSEDGSYFYEVGRVDGHGNSKQTIEYQFEDHSHFAPVAYYRLKQVDYDGAYEYSPVQRVEIRTQGTQRTVNIFPYEVANGRLTVQSNQPLILQQRVIYSTSGARYTQVPTLQLSNAHGVELNVDNLPAGLYILRLITSEGQKVTGNFLVP